MSMKPGDRVSWDDIGLQLEDSRQVPGRSTPSVDSASGQGSQELTVALKLRRRAVVMAVMIWEEKPSSEEPK